MTADIVFLVADNDMEQTIRGLMNHPERLGIRKIEYSVFRHPNRDAGCYSAAHEFLRLHYKTHKNALVLFDYHGCGRENESVEAIQSNLEDRLTKHGWTNHNCRVIVIPPELEIWVWSTSLQVDVQLGWSGKNPDLRTWLKQQGLWGENIKPTDPKTAVQQALRIVQKPYSSAIFKQLAENISLRSCTDESFNRFRSTLQEWFPSN